MTDWLNLKRDREKECHEVWRSRWARMHSNYAFYGGEHKDKKQKDRLQKADRADVSWNSLMVLTNSAASREIVQGVDPVFRGRIKRLKALPPEDMLNGLLGSLSPQLADAVRNSFEDDSFPAQALTELLRWIRQTADADPEESQAFLDCFICGVGWMEVRLDWLSEPSPKIVHECLDPWECVPDVGSKKRNFADKDYVFRYREVPRPEAETLYGEDKVATLATDDNKSTFRSRSHHDKPAYAPGAGIWSPYTNSLTLTEYEWREQQLDRIEVDDPETAEAVAFDGEDKYREYKAERESAGFEVGAPARIPRWKYQRAVLAGEEVMRGPDDAPIQEFSFRGLTCFPKKSRDQGTDWLGLIDYGKDPQLWQDVMMGAMIDQVRTSPKAPVHAEKGAFENLQEAKCEIARDDGIVIYKDRAIADGKVKFGSPPQFSGAHAAIYEYAKEAVGDSMGVSQVAAGQVDDPRRAPFGTVNLLAQLAQLAHAIAYDELAEFRKGVARVDMMYAAEYLSPEMIRRVLGDEWFQALPAPEDEEHFGEALLNLERYDLVIDETTESATNTLKLLEILFNSPQMIQLAQQSGVILPPHVIADMFVAAGLPAPLGEEIKAASQFAAVSQEQGGDPNAVIQKATQTIIGALPPDLREAVTAELQSRAQARAGETIQ